MVKGKKICISVVILVCVLLTGCASPHNHVWVSKADSPESFIKRFYKAYYIEKTADPEKLSENLYWTYGCLDDTNELVNGLKKNLNGATYEKIKILSTEKIEDNIWEVKYMLKHVYSGKTESMNYVSYVAKDGEEYKLVYKGLLDWNYYNNVISSQTNDYYIKEVIEARYVDKTILQFVFVNDTNNVLQLHKKGGIVTVTTDLNVTKMESDYFYGTYSQSFDKINIKKCGEEKIQLTFKGLKGEIKTVKINALEKVDNILDINKTDRVNIKSYKFELK